MREGRYEQQTEWGTFQILGRSDGQSGSSSKISVLILSPARGEWMFKARYVNRSSWADPRNKGVVAIKANARVAHSSAVASGMVDLTYGDPAAKSILAKPLHVK